jgi:cytochrome c oxidase subunit I+III
VAGLAADVREMVCTTVADAKPDSRMMFPPSTPAPFIAALATMALFVGSIFTPWAVVWGSIPLAIAMIWWFWPPRSEAEEELALEKPDDALAMGKR